MKREPARCEWWPHCGCRQRWHFEEDPDTEFTPEDIEMYAATLIRMLECVASHCPDKRYREHAVTQLMHPAFTPYRQH
ncbi:hypothetical protein [uncultured Bradyrhizobium sp.]|jgi:hypothetical protein|uniref:hypothetical protein n=1 Tax=uncultured Bradyrhizobium sp. TaxID=199684 RepID=UPI002601EDE6|nr:hypothetical protein [uncultured Bradyrhizobium sp.]